MEKMIIEKGAYLKRMLKDICGLNFESEKDEDLYFNEFILEARKTTQWFEARGSNLEEAEQKARKKRQTILEEDNNIVNTILDYRDIDMYISIDGSRPTQETLLRRYIDYLSSTFSRICDFSINDSKLIDPNNVVETIRKVFITNEIVNGTYTTEELQEKKENECKSTQSTVPTNQYMFSVLEWGAIFHYANSIDALGSGTTIDKLRKFKDKHFVTTSLSCLKNKYHDAAKRINSNNADFPIGKLKKILPFLKKYYRKSFVKATSDIEILLEERLNRDKFR